jgi:signal transduction histidine kinase
VVWVTNLKLKVDNFKKEIANLLDKLKRVKTNSLKFKIWSFLIIFSILILLFLWIFQILFLNSFYERAKVKDIADTIETIKITYQNNTLYNTIDSVSRDKGICIQILRNNATIYDSTAFNRGCLPDQAVRDYKQAFINSLLDEQTYKLINPRYDNEVLIRAIRLNLNTYAFVSTSLEPLDAAITILQNQLIIVTFLVLLLSFVVAFFISKKLSKPIEKINRSDSKISEGDYDVKFYIDEDIDELNNLVDTLNATTKELSKTEELRRELMANVSHDLKTPLTMIKAYAEMVRDLTYKDKKKCDENLNVIIEETDRLNILVNDILDLSVLQSGTKKLNITEFDLTELMKNILRRYKILEQNSKYNFIFDNEEIFLVKADAMRIEQVIYNLLNNAVNYTGQDKKVTINILDTNEDAVRVSITDTGKGIKKEELKLIWKKYYKVDKTHKRDKIGTGIGLSIVENILINQKLKYGVDSVINKGTTFWFEVKKNKK